MSGPRMELKLGPFEVSIIEKFRFECNLDKNWDEKLLVRLTGI